MAPSASQLRVGQAFVEMGIDQAFLAAECEKAKAQVAKMAGQLGPAATSAATSGSLQERYITGAIRVGAVTRLATGGIEAITAAIRISQGDWDAVHETMARMPLGVGGFHTALLALKEAYTGAGAAAERFKASVERSIQFQAGIQSLRDLSKTVETHIAVMRAGHFEGQELQAAADAQAAREKIMRDAEKTGLLTRNVPTFVAAPWWKRIPAVLTKGAIGSWTERGEDSLVNVKTPPNVAKALGDVDREEAEKLKAIARARQDVLNDFWLREVLAGHIGAEAELTVLEDKYNKEFQTYQKDEKMLNQIIATYAAERTAILKKEAEKQAADKQKAGWEAFDEAMKEGQAELDVAGEGIKQQLQAAGDLVTQWHRQHDTTAGFQAVTELQRQVMIAGASDKRDPTTEELKELNERNKAEAEETRTYRRTVVAALGTIGKPQ
jgi:hypothetical protein